MDINISEEVAQAMGKRRDADLKLFTWLAKFQDVETAE